MADSPALDSPVSLAVVILTFDEEANLEDALRSVEGWASEVHVVDVMMSVVTSTFTNVFWSSFTVHWTSGTAADGYNPAGTSYEVERSTSSLPGERSANSCLSSRAS